MTSIHPNAGPDHGIELEAIDAAVLAVVASDPARTWHAQAIITATGLSMIDALVALARLTTSGRIERRSPGRYRDATETSETTASRMRLRVLGA